MTNFLINTAAVIFTFSGLMKFISGQQPPTLPTTRAIAFFTNPTGINGTIEFTSSPGIIPPQPPIFPIFPVSPISIPFPLYGQPKVITQVNIKVNLKGIPTGTHGWHIHESGDIYTNGCTSAGPHFNPLGKEHGAPWFNINNKHFGDLGNFQSDSSQNVIASLTVTDGTISLIGPNSILGRAIIIHEKRDDLGKGTPTNTSKLNGNSGSRIACAVIVAVNA